MFNIERATYPYAPNGGQDDVKVRNTILFVLELFFQEHEDALITICDVVDGKQFAWNVCSTFGFGNSITIV